MIGFRVGFREVADRVHVLRHPVLDVNVTLIVGSSTALLVDTLSGAGQASALLDEIRRVTPYPLILVNTHHHFDHCFGNATLVAAGAGPIWAHEWTASQLREHSAQWQRDWYAQWLPTEPELAAELGAATIVAPDRTVTVETPVDLGGRTVLLRHHGRAHTAGDLVTWVPDAAVLVAGDLVEQGGPPSFADSYPLDWPDTLAATLAAVTPPHLDATRPSPAATAPGGELVVVPGHGTPVGAEFTRTLHARLADLDWLIRDGYAAGASAESVAAHAPFGASPSLVAVSRGYAHLSGRGTGM